MRVNVNATASARFKLVAKKADTGEVSRDTGWFKNIVLDSGLARMKTGVWGDTCVVGSGDSTPIVSQTKLDSPIAATTTIRENSAVSGTVDGKKYNGRRMVFRFNAGQAAGNISEVCIGWGLNNSWNRALVKNASGTPTTITVQSDEYLEVTVEIRVFFEQNISGRVSVVDAVGDVVSEHGWTGSIKVNDGSWNTFESGIVRIGTLQIYNTSNQSIGSFPSKVVVDNISGQNTAEISLNIDHAVGSWGRFLSTVSGLVFSGNDAQYDITFDTPVVKTATERFTIRFTVKWGRA